MVSVLGLPDGSTVLTMSPSVSFSLTLSALSCLWLKTLVHPEGARCRSENSFQ